MQNSFNIGDTIVFFDKNKNIISEEVTDILQLAEGVNYLTAGFAVEPTDATYHSIDEAVDAYLESQNIILRIEMDNEASSTNPGSFTVTQTFNTYFKRN